MATKPLPEVTISSSSRSNNNKKKTKGRTGSIIRPPPERSIQSYENSNNNVNMSNAQLLGIELTSEMLKRLMTSNRNNDGRFYWYCFELFKRINVVNLIECIMNLVNGEGTQYQMITKLIIDCLLPIAKYPDIDIITMINAKLIVAAQHPFIRIRYPIEKISIIKLVKLTSDNNNNNGKNQDTNSLDFYFSFIYKMWTFVTGYLLEHIVFLFCLLICCT